MAWFDEWNPEWSLIPGEFWDSEYGRLIMVARLSEEYEHDPDGGLDMLVSLKDVLIHEGATAGPAGALARAVERDFLARATRPPEPGGPFFSLPPKPPA